MGACCPYKEMEEEHSRHGISKGKALTYKKAQCVEETDRRGSEVSRTRHQGLIGDNKGFGFTLMALRWIKFLNKDVTIYINIFKR